MSFFCHLLTSSSSCRWRHFAPPPWLSISPPTSHSSFPLRNKGMPDVELSNRLAISTTGVRHMRGSLFFLLPVRVCLCRHLNVCVGSAWLCDGFFVLAETIWSQSCTTPLHTPTQKRAHTHTHIHFQHPSHPHAD